MRVIQDCIALIFKKVIRNRCSLAGNLVGDSFIEWVLLLYRIKDNLIRKIKDLEIYSNK